MNSPAPILVADLYPELRELLLVLLKRLTEEEWQRPTAAGKWTVKDVALHLLGGDVSSLSRRRDQFVPPRGGRSLSNWNELVSYINWLNATWVEATQRMSARLLCDLLAVTGPQLSEYFKSLDPFALGEPVSWVGPEPAPQWLDIAREYTEQWHHQQQIRDATARPGLYEPRLFAPVIDTFRTRSATHVSRCGSARRHRHPACNLGTRRRRLDRSQSGEPLGSGSWHRLCRK
jgi:uncharacterized protein (TIGR03083 family)